jgi:hypothetical protein
MFPRRERTERKFEIEQNYDVASFRQPTSRWFGVLEIWVGQDLMKFRRSTGKTKVSGFLVAGLIGFVIGQVARAEPHAILTPGACDAVESGCVVQKMALLDPPRVVVYTTRAPVRLLDENGVSNDAPNKKRAATRGAEASSQTEEEQP